MTETEIARRLTDFTLGQRVLHLTDSLDLTDEVYALLEEAAQRLIDASQASPEPGHRLIDGDDHDPPPRHHPEASS